MFANWQNKLVGRKPTAGELATIHGLGARPGKQALASAMAMRECGVTGAQIVMACGAPQLNKMRGFITDGLLKREAASLSNEGHTVYKLALTSKGAAKVKAAAEKPAADTEAKPAKAKSARKAKVIDTEKGMATKLLVRLRGSKAKPASVEPVNEPVSEPVTVEPVTVEPVSEPVAVTATPVEVQ
jgi:hypothetical protein